MQLSGTMTYVRCLAPVAEANAFVLVLGSMPGKVSLKAGEYYAHPRNAFWPIVEAIAGIPRNLSYDERCEQLVRRGIALWDVLGACFRSSSLDSDIVDASIVANDFSSFFSAHAAITGICFNGAKAERAYVKHVLPGLPPSAAGIRRQRLPSTSPANASISFESKLAAWRQAVHDQQLQSTAYCNATLRALVSSRRR